MTAKSIFTDGAEKITANYGRQEQASKQNGSAVLDMEQARTFERDNSNLNKNNNSNAANLQRLKEPSELQQVHVRKLMMAIQTILDDFASSKQKSNLYEKEEMIFAAKIEKARQNIGRLPKLDSPEYIKLKKLRWEQKIMLACNGYDKTLNQFQVENEEFVKLLKLFRTAMKRVLSELVAVQPLPESMRNKIKGGNELPNLDTPIEDEASKKEKTAIEIVSPPVKTDNQEIAEVTEAVGTKTIVLSAWQKKMREKYSEAALNPLLSKNTEVVIYTDGSLVSTNEHTEEKIDSGGYAAILLFRKMNDTEIMISGHKARPSSAEYMELLAINKALKRLKKYRIKGKVVLYSDALNIVNKFNTKLAGWKDCGWKRADGKYIRYWKLWKKIYKYSKRIDLRICWVKGHAESQLNKRCDGVARAEAKLRAI